MTAFNRLCKDVEKLNPPEYGAVITDKTLKIIPALHNLTEDYETTAGMMASFMIASVYADGKLDESEYILMLPMLKLFFGADFDFEAAKTTVKLFRPEGNELKRVVDYLVDVLGEVDEELKNDIITVCLLICAVDGKITLREKRYIKQLIR